MVRIPHFILATLVLLQTVGIGVRDIVQFDELLEHAQFHQETYGDDFFTFLSKHYGDQKEEHESNHQEEKEQHGELPFQKATHVAEIAISFQIHQLEQARYIVESERQENFSYLNGASLFEPLGIFQPPQV